MRQGAARPVPQRVPARRRAGGPSTPFQRRAACPAPSLLRVAQPCLERVNQLAQRHAQAARDKDQRLERRGTPTLLQLADVVARNPGRVRKLLLRHATPGTKLADSERQGATLARQRINHARQPSRARISLPDVDLGMVPKVQGMATRIGV